MEPDNDTMTAEQTISLVSNTPDETMASPEPKQKPKNIRFKAHPELSYEMKTQVEDMNLALEVLDSVDQWFQQLNPDDLTFDDISRIRTDCHEFSIDLNLVGKNQLLSDKKDQIPVFRAAAMERTGRLRINQKQQKDYQEIEIINSKDLDEQKRNINKVIHDILGQDIMSIRLTMPLIDEAGQIDEKNREIFRSAVNGEKKNMERFTQQAGQNIEVVKLDEDQIYSLIQDSFSRYTKSGLLNIEFNFNIPEGIDLKARACKGQLESLFNNIATNLVKVYANDQNMKKVDITFRINQNHQFEIDVQDYGKGLPYEIEENGYTYGVSKWPQRGTEEHKFEGSGIGMAESVRMVKENGNIDVIPENLVSPGGIIQGAINRVIFPDII